MSSGQVYTDSALTNLCGLGVSSFTQFMSNFLFLSLSLSFSQSSHHFVDILLSFFVTRNFYLDFTQKKSSSIIIEKKKTSWTQFIHVKSTFWTFHFLQFWRSIHSITLTQTLKTTFLLQIKISFVFDFSSLLFLHMRHKLPFPFLPLYPFIWEV